MAFINTGTQRTMSLSVTKNGNDNSSFTMSPTSTPPYLDFDGKTAFGSYPTITEDEMQKLSNTDFTARVDAWKTHLQTTYATSDPNLWTDISNSFKYVNGLIVRLITPSSKKYQITTYPSVVQEAISMSIEDPYENDRYVMTIPVGSNTSNIIQLKTASTTTDQDIEITNSVVLSDSNFGLYSHYQNSSDLGVGISTLYPIPPVITMTIDEGSITSPNSGLLYMDVNVVGDNVFDQGADVGVCYSSVVSNPTISGAHSVDYYGGTPFGTTITGLVLGQTYNLIPYVTTGGATYYGTKTTFLFN